MGDSYAKIRIGAVQAAPVFLNREESVEKACRLIREAGRLGVRLVGFPEGFIPGHPLWYHFMPATERRAVQMAARLFTNSVVVPGPATDRLCEAARDAGAYVVMGICEKLPDTLGTMYNSQIVISPEGRIIGKHQKLMPTVGERIVHTGGFGDSLGAVQTEFGKIGGLICGESSNPLLVFSLLAEQTMVHVISWPSRFQKEGVTCGERANIAGQAVATMSKSFVINAVGTMSDEMVDMLAYTDADRANLSNPAASGGSSIISPFGRVLAGPMGSEEGILWVDVDLQDCVVARVEHDFSGHYNRPDVFQLQVNTGHPLIYAKGNGTQGVTPPALGVRAPSGDAEEGGDLRAGPMEAQGTRPPAADPAPAGPL